ncbi:putative origin recognition complex subunit orc5 protein [Phialemonium atrogriseum]|uniref:Origin recognition complex subunit orc5 protein n=1 Tax=Phialemonium atrogriseum TaxID=1093897 RepID=A0AAJ0FRR3_9PEZI|nr:putative origin recognition complex subunit orc5 protein [Phialemonium atrogriseum]KAK1772694.1 putative origin recognition complex subunit orc5 protein [Phialemonium atrogriseum]
MDSLFQLPDELVLATLVHSFPCRDLQINALATLLFPNAAPCRNLVIHGTESTGKSAIIESLLEKLAEVTESSQTGKLKYAIVNSIECITGRHLFERTIGKVADALDWDNRPTRCENMSRLTVELSKMLLSPDQPDGLRFVLVLDAIDRQREAPPTLLPALARLSEIIPSLTTVFIVTCPPAGLLHTSFVPHIHFPNYTKSEFVAILSLSPPPTLANTTKEETTELWARFTSAVHDTLARAAVRTLPAFRHACHALWPRFTAPILAGTHGPREFSKLIVAARVHFQDETLLDPGIVAAAPSHSFPNRQPPSAVTSAAPSPARAPRPGPSNPTAAPSLAGPDLSNLLPTTARLLLLAAYLASHNAARHDLTLFSTHHHGRRRRRGGLSVAGGGAGRRGSGAAARGKHRKIARKLLGAHAFVLERMMAVFAAVRREWDAGGAAGAADGPRAGAGMDADVGMAIATLASLRLLVRVGGGGVGGDPLDRGGKWRVNVGWEVVRGLGRSMGVEVEEWLID